MLLFCLLSVILVIGGLVLRRELGMFLTNARLAVFGLRVPVRKPALRREAVRRDTPPLQLGSAPPPLVVTRPRR